ncbi:hypothetical protein K1I93_09395, partial [Streptococcus australis]|nr:hypothetical protein [Streptococcus australis]
MGPHGDSRGGGGNDYSDAKDLLDKIGQKVHDQVKNGDDAKKYIEALKGDLQEAARTIPELNYTADTCKLV